MEKTAPRICLEPGSSSKAASRSSSSGTSLNRKAGANGLRRCHRSSAHRRTGRSRGHGVERRQDSARNHRTCNRLRIVVCSNFASDRIVDIASTNGRSAGPLEVAFEARFRAARDAGSVAQTVDRGVFARFRLGADHSVSVRASFRKTTSRQRFR